MAGSEGDKTRSHLSETVARAIIAFLLHLLLGALAVGLIFWLTNGVDSASDTLKSSVASADDVEAAVLAQLADARFALVQWTIVSLAVSWITATVFLYAAQRHEPRNDNEAAQRFSVWGVLLVLALALATLLWWRWVSLAQVSLALIANNYATILTVSFVATFLGYYLSTALIVKNTVKPSVPGARALPSLRR